MTNTPEQPRRRRSSSPFTPAPEPVIETFAEGDRVVHDAHGLGRVVTVEAYAVTVDFGSGAMRIASPYARLHQL